MARVKPSRNSSHSIYWTCVNAPRAPECYWPRLTEVGPDGSGVPHEQPEGIVAEQSGQGGDVDERAQPTIFEVVKCPWYGEIQ